MAVLIRRVRVIAYSDRGGQYYSKGYRDFISTYELEQSMSRKGNCWNNFCVKSFFHAMKVKANQYELIMTREQISQTLLEYVWGDYNRTRSQSVPCYASKTLFNEVSSLDDADQF